MYLNSCVDCLQSSHIYKLGGGRLGGRGGAGVVTAYIRHSTDVRAEWPPFSALPGI